MNFWGNKQMFKHSFSSGGHGGFLLKPPNNHLSMGFFFLMQAEHVYSSWPQSFEIVFIVFNCGLPLCQV